LLPIIEKTENGIMIESKFLFIWPKYGARLCENKYEINRNKITNKKAILSIQIAMRDWRLFRANNVK
jgi:hypothetical protein